MWSLSVCVLLCSVVSALSAGIRAKPTTDILVPAAALLTHAKNGDYIDQVQGKDYYCRPEIAFVVDTSPSIGRSTASQFIVSLLANIESQLARLPNGPGDSSQGSLLHMILFNKEAHGHKLDSVGNSQLNIKKNIQQGIRAAVIEGGTCISCGVERAMLLIMDHALSAESPKYIVIISDGFDNDRLGHNKNTPEEQAALARAAGISILSMGVVGKKDEIAVGPLMSIADTSDRFWEVRTRSDSNEHAISLVDLIAGESCMGPLKH